MSHFLTVEFQFEIGDFVYFRSARNDREHVPSRYLVMERYAQQCHGGVQRLYKLDGDFAKLVPEICLTREEPAYDSSRERYSWRAFKAEADKLAEKKENKDVDTDAENG